MKRFKTFLVVAGVVLAPFATRADEIKPAEAYSLHLGTVVGTVYYNAKDTDDRLVATLSSGPDATPVRMVTSLSAGQSMTISVPRGPGERALEVTFVRRGDKVFATDAETVVGSIR